MLQQVWNNTKKIYKSQRVTVTPTVLNNILSRVRTCTKWVERKSIYTLSCTLFRIQKSTFVVLFCAANRKVGKKVNQLMYLKKNCCWCLTKIFKIINVVFSIISNMFLSCTEIEPIGSYFNWYNFDKSDFSLE